VGANGTSRLDDSDAEMILRSRVDPEAFSGIFDRHFAAIHRYLARRVGVSRADDLAAQTFVVAFRRRADFDDHRGNARPWLFGIATNVMRNELRTEQRMLAAIARLDPASAGDLLDEAERSVARAAAAGEVARLATTLAGLDRGQRDVLLLHAWGDLSQAEIAQALGIALGTVYSRLSRARAALRQAADALAAEEHCPPKERSR
jgi:RNA polymerase sigma-70 factor (ECF subfamily)